MVPHHPRAVVRQNRIEWLRPRITRVAPGCHWNSLLLGACIITPMASPFQLYVGVDIAAKSFSAVWSSDPANVSRPQSFDQTPDGFIAFEQQLATTGVAPEATLIVL